MKFFGIITCFFLSAPSALLFSASAEPRLPFIELASRAQEAIEEFIKKPPTCKYGFYDLITDKYTEIKKEELLQGHPVVLANPGLIVVKQCVACIQKAADTPMPIWGINEKIKVNLTESAPQVPQHMYWLTGYISPDQSSCYDALAIVPNFSYAQEILAFFQKSGIAHPSIKLFESCGKYTDADLTRTFVDNYGLLLGGQVIKQTSDIEYQIHDWTAHFLVYLLAPPQKFSAIHDFFHTLDDMIGELSEKYPEEIYLVDTPIKDTMATTLYAEGSLSRSCIAGLIDHVVSTVWCFEARSLLACLLKRHPFLTQMQLVQKEIPASMSRIGVAVCSCCPEIEVPDLNCISDKQKCLEFVVNYLFTCNGELIFKKFISVEEISHRFKPSFDKAFTGGYFDMTAFLAVGNMHNDIVSEGKGRRLTFDGYVPEVEEIIQRRRRQQEQMGMRQVIQVLFDPRQGGFVVQGDFFVRFSAARY